ncbi:MAG: ABC transporter ATP-binding protein, partial [Erysipelotrichaceae bacterium]
ALKIVANAINQQKDETKMGLMIISHYERFCNLVQPSFVHIIIDGKIVRSGDYSLVDKIDTDGYDWLIKELNIKINKEDKNPVLLGTCGNSGQGK